MATTAGTIICAHGAIPVIATPVPVHSPSTLRRRTRIPEPHTMTRATHFYAPRAIVMAVAAPSPAPTPPTPTHLPPAPSPSLLIPNHTQELRRYRGHQVTPTIGSTSTTWDMSVRRVQHQSRPLPLPITRAMHTDTEDLMAGTVLF